MFKNVATKLVVYVFDSTTNLPKTGDAANITAYVSKDYGTVTVLADTSATEMDSTNAKGFYLFDVAQAESNGDALLFSAKSSTSNMVALAMPALVFTTPANFTSQSIDGSGRVDVIKVNGTSQTAKDLGASATQTGDSYAIVNDGTNGNAAIKTAAAAIKAKTDNLPSDPADASDIAASFSTVNSTLALIAGYIDTEVAAIKAKTDNLPSDPADASDIASAFSSLSTAIGLIPTNPLTSLGTHAPADWINAASIAASALNGKGDWSTLDVAGVRTAVGLASANLDTQLGAIGAVTTKLNTGLQSDGASGYQFTALALAEAPAGGGGSGIDEYMAARSYGPVDPEDNFGRQVFRSPPNAEDGGGVAKVRFSRTTPRGGRLVELDPDV